MLPWLAVVLNLAVVARVTGAAFPEPFDTEPQSGLRSPEAAASSFRLPPGFEVQVFAAEPDVRQPIAMALDPRGRLWVAENYTYAEDKTQFARQLNDRVLILNDTNHDGRMDERIVFWDQAKILTSVLPGDGGVYLMCPPQLLFLPDRNGDDVPDGPPEVLLDGFADTTGNRHTFANGLKWGPDGWLWGRVGISSAARIGVPGAGEDQRIEMRGGIWRFHPRRRVVEAVCHGTTNPWGLDWNALGEPFFINTVIGHLWHAIPGAHFQRMHGDDVHPRNYVLLAQHADHYHFDTGAGWTKSRAAMDGSAFAAGSDGLGGGHAHSGLMIYQGLNWPESMRGRLFTLNLHGRRINQERLERSGSGYVGRHEPDFIAVGDPWFRGLELICGPDGGVFVADWSDTGECHEQDGVHRSSGRIYKISYGSPRLPAVLPLTARSDAQLIPLLLDPNEWVSREARRTLADRVHGGHAPGPLVDSLLALYSKQTSAPGRLRAMWGLQAVGGISADWLLEQTRDPDESVRSWAVRLLVDDWPTDDPAGRPVQVAAQVRRAAAPETRRVIGRLVELAETEPSGLVRLYLAATLQRMAPADRGRLAMALVQRGEDANDPNLPGLIWYGIEPWVGTDPGAAASLAIQSRLPQVREWIARCLTERIDVQPEPLSELLARVAMAPASAQADVLRGMRLALRGWRKAPAPGGWSALVSGSPATADPEVRDLVRDIGLVFGDGRALDDLRSVVVDPNATADARRRALRSLVDSRADGVGPLLGRAVKDSVLRTEALKGFVQLGDPEGPAQVTDRYRWVPQEDRPALVSVLVTRAPFAKALLDAVASGAAQRSEITPFHARQILSLNDPVLTARLIEVWGVVKPAGGDKDQAKQEWRKRLSPEALQGADLSRGRASFQKVCASCHRLYGEGGTVGPDLTGSGRTQLDYLVEHIVDPNSVVPADYRVAVATLKDGRVLNGVLKARTERTVTLVGQSEETTVERADIESLEQPEQSMMPEGLLDSLAPAEARDLIAYLMSPRQVPLPQ